MSNGFGETLNSEVGLCWITPTQRLRSRVVCKVLDRQRQDLPTSFTPRTWLLLLDLLKEQGNTYSERDSPSSSSGKQMKKTPFTPKIVRITLSKTRTWLLQVRKSISSPWVVSPHHVQSTLPSCLTKIDLPVWIKPATLERHSLRENKDPQ